MAPRKNSSPATSGNSQRKRGSSKSATPAPNNQATASGRVAKASSTATAAGHARRGGTRKAQKEMEEALQASLEEAGSAGGAPLPPTRRITRSVSRGLEQAANKAKESHVLEQSTDKKSMSMATGMRAAAKKVSSAIKKTGNSLMGKMAAKSKKASKGKGAEVLVVDDNSDDDSLVPASAGTTALTIKEEVDEEEPVAEMAPLGKRKSASRNVRLRKPTKVMETISEQPSSPVQSKADTPGPIVSSFEQCGEVEEVEEGEIEEEVVEDRIAAYAAQTETEGLETVLETIEAEDIPAASGFQEASDHDADDDNSDAADEASDAADEESDSAEESDGETQVGPGDLDTAVDLKTAKQVEESTETSASEPAAAQSVAGDEGEVEGASNLDIPKPYGNGDYYNIQDDVDEDLENSPGFGRPLTSGEIEEVIANSTTAFTREQVKDICGQIRGPKRAFTNIRGVEYEVVAFLDPEEMAQKKWRVFPIPFEEFGVGFLFLDQAGVKKIVSVEELARVCKYVNVDKEKGETRESVLHQEEKKRKRDPVSDAAEEYDRTFKRMKADLSTWDDEVSFHRNPVEYGYDAFTIGDINKMNVHRARRQAEDESGWIEQSYRSFMAKNTSSSSSRHKADRLDAARVAETESLYDEITYNRDRAARRVNRATSRGYIPGPGLFRDWETIQRAFNHILSTEDDLISYPLWENASDMIAETCKLINNNHEYCKLWFEKDDEVFIAGLKKAIVAAQSERNRKFRAALSNERFWDWSGRGVQKEEEERPFVGGFQEGMEGFNYEDRDTGDEDIRGPLEELDPEGWGLGW